MGHTDMRTSGLSRRFLLILDDPQMPEAENWPVEQKVTLLKQTTDADPSIVRYAIINSEMRGKAQSFFLLHMMAFITHDYHENQDEDSAQESESGGEQLPG